MKLLKTVKTYGNYLHLNTKTKEHPKQVLKKVTGKHKLVDEYKEMSKSLNDPSSNGRNMIHICIYIYKSAFNRSS